MEVTGEIFRIREILRKPEQGIEVIADLENIFQSGVDISGCFYKIF
jgi:hypothetical protein